jgi:hypothetical protein
MDGQDAQSTARGPIGRGTTSDVARRALHAALRGEPAAVSAYAQAERVWALDVLAGIIHGGGDERTAGDALGVESEP